MRNICRPPSPYHSLHRWLGQITEPMLYYTSDTDSRLVCTQLVRGVRRASENVRFHPTISKFLKIVISVLFRSAPAIAIALEQGSFCAEYFSSGSPSPIYVKSCIPWPDQALPYAGTLSKHFNADVSAAREESEAEGVDDSLEMARFCCTPEDSTEIVHNHGTKLQSVLRRGPIVFGFSVLEAAGRIRFKSARSAGFTFGVGREAGASGLRTSTGCEEAIMIKDQSSGRSRRR
ncbi:hypothetical protein EIP91_008425 [Steccherinum ochraceum]|uniref:Uncharacterized protein n=1 Tax=Steccherinum ochraceum TaxID=92696 RepID=A0A4R0R571_9APHY|nr:hypothetical protein EIP91_008425 [Steccherinum ochraceum]